jgi:phosphoribosyl 1,2-cyclic phosphodiesterase
LGLLTDAGCVTPHLLAQLAGCQALLLECNHDTALLAVSRYPNSLKRRIAGRYGHLSNDTAAQILAASLHAGLRHVVAAHLSRENNRPELALAALATACGASTSELQAAGPLWGFDWLDVG